MDTSNYWFSEVEGSLESSTFTSIIIDHLTKKCTEKRSIYLISDGCNYQNRNTVLANALLKFSIKHKVKCFRTTKFP